MFGFSTDFINDYVQRHKGLHEPKDMPSITTKPGERLQNALNNHDDLTDDQEFFFYLQQSATFKHLCNGIARINYPTDARYRQRFFFSEAKASDTSSVLENVQKSSFHTLMTPTRTKS
jgi:hypothetical protein